LAGAQIAPFHLGVTLGLHVTGTAALNAESDIVQLGYQPTLEREARTRLQTVESHLASSIAASVAPENGLPSVIRAGFGEHSLLRTSGLSPATAESAVNLRPLLHGHTRLCSTPDPLRSSLPQLLMQLDWVVDSEAALPIQIMERSEWVDMPRHLTLALQVALRYSLLRLRQHRTELLLRLAPTQRPVLPLLAEGLSQRQIAERLGRSLHTVHDHVKGAYASLGISARHQLFVLWNGGNLSDLGDIE
jgi:DNA-binding CsgD family transcriptional regulator